MSASRPRRAAAMQDDTDEFKVNKDEAESDHDLDLDASSRPTKRQRVSTKGKVKPSESGSQTMPRAKGLRGSKTKAAKGSKVAGRLAAFKTMPIDVLANILSHVDPLTLIRFSRVSKAIREILLHPSGNHFWRDARVRVEIPKLKARDITDRQLLGLVYDKACHGRGCQMTNVQEMYWDYSGRLCSSCREETRVNTPNQLKKYIAQFHPRAVECSLVNTGSGYRKPRGIAKRSAELHAMEKEFSASDAMRSEAIESYVQQRTTLKSRIVADAKRLEDWEIRQSDIKYTQDFERQQSREASIREKLLGLGWTDRRLGHAWKTTKMVEQNRPLTIRIWNKIKQPLIAFIEEDLAKRKLAARKARDGSRRTYLKGCYVTLREEHKEDLFPSFNVFAGWPAVFPFWNEADNATPHDELQSYNSVLFDNAAWEAVLPSVRLDIVTYMDDVRRIALERVRAIYDRNGLALPSNPFEPTQSHFRLKVDRDPNPRDWQVPDEVLPFPTIHKRMVEIENSRSLLTDHWSNWTKPVEFRLREEVVPDPLW